MGTNANMCWEDFWGDGKITLFSKTDKNFEPNDKHFHWNAASGAVTREGSSDCMTSAGAGQPVLLQKCTGAANQQWVADWSPAPSPSPSSTTCAKLGCIAYKQGVPCQCNTDCHQWGNCCSDFDQICKNLTATGKAVLV